MDNLENQPAATPAPEHEDLQAQVRSLLNLLNSVLILVLLLSGSLGFFLFKQVKALGNEVTGLRAFVAQAERNTPALEEFARKLVEFGKTHPDFGPIVTKYKLQTVAPTNAAPAGATTKK